MPAPERKPLAVLAEYYPRAWEHLQAASDRKRELAAKWNAALAADLLDHEVVTDPDGRGRIVILVGWPPKLQECLTELFASCIRELWACLDALVVETVEAFSVLKNPRNAAAPRFFPMAGSREDFEALLEECCLDGILRLHFRMIRDCQPFQTDPDDERIDRFRVGLSRMLEWENALLDGAVISAWATPTDPQIRVGPPVILDWIEPAEPGELQDERIVARYQVHHYQPGRSVQGRTGTYIDLAFVPGFDPVDFEDTFDRRLNDAIDIVGRFVLSFASLSNDAPGSRRVLLGKRHQTDAWIDATPSSRQWSADDLAGLAESDIGLGRVVDAQDLTLIVVTPTGVYERVIPSATPLRAHHDRRGVAAESAVQDAAATWGLPEFVMVPSVERKGTGVREISDGLLVVGDLGVVVQVKTREGDPGSAERESNWISKQIAAARKQIKGTVRRLKAGPARMVNGRGQEVYVEGPHINWVGVVILEHPQPPGDIRAEADVAVIPSVVLLRRDWEFLFDQLRSTRAVVSYLHRVGSSPVVLGTEPERYYELAAADAAAVPEPLPAAMAGTGRLRSLPMLPTAPAGSDDEVAHGLFRIILEDIATIPIEPEKYAARSRILASVDSLPVGDRTELGRLILESLGTARKAEPGSTLWRFRIFRGVNEDQLCFGVCSVYNEMTRHAFTSWLQLRHYEFGQQVGLTSLRSIGVLLTPRTDGHRDWDTTMTAVEGDVELKDEVLAQYRDLWNNPRNFM